MTKNSLVIFLLFNSLFTYCQKNHPQNKQELISVCDKFMDMFKSGKYVEACDLLKSFSAIEDYKLDTLATTAKNQITSISSSYGKAISFEQLSEKELKNSLSKLIYLLKFEKYYLKFRFILYNNGAGWTITDFTFDGEIGDLF